MAGRKPGYRHIDETRAKIKASQLINRLQDHVFADTPILDASQVNAAKALLAKVLPDLHATELTVEDKRDATDWTRDELVALINDARTRGNGTAAPNGRDPEPDQIH